MPHKKPGRGERATKSKANTAKKVKAKVNPLKKKAKTVAFGSGANSAKKPRSGPKKA